MCHTFLRSETFFRMYRAGENGAVKASKPVARKGVWLMTSTQVLYIGDLIDPIMIIGL